MQALEDLFWDIDKNEEIVGLWFELMYLKICLAEIVKNNPSLQGIDSRNCKIQAQKFIKDKFPKLKIQFPE